MIVIGEYLVFVEQTANDVLKLHM